MSRQNSHPHLKSFCFAVARQVVGFGNTAYHASETLRFARLPFVDREICKREVEDKLAIYTLLPDKFCVGSVNGALLYSVMTLAESAC